MRRGELLQTTATTKGLSSSSSSFKSISRFLLLFDLEQEEEKEIE
jgi:hypothetical protein